MIAASIGLRLAEMAMGSKEGWESTWALVDFAKEIRESKARRTELAATFGVTEKFLISWANNIL